MASRWREGNSHTLDNLLSVFIIAFTRGKQSYAYVTKTTSLIIHNRYDYQIYNLICTYTVCKLCETWVTWVSNSGEHSVWMRLMLDIG